MDDKARDLILAAEISGLLHDLGKLRPEFAKEGMDGDGCVNLTDSVKAYGIGAAHGAILEDWRAYPESNTEAWLQDIKYHAGWAKCLEIPSSWIADKTVQAHGLGDALRQHHANPKLDEGRFTLLGDLYSFGADTRDSALDKGSGKTKSSKQDVKKGFIADSFGHELESYGPEQLAAIWQRIAECLPGLLFKNKAWQNVTKTRARVVNAIESEFQFALGETRRPTNDVSLWHHSFSAASLFKAAVAECVLREDFSHLQSTSETDCGLFDEAQLGRVRFRLLGIRWDWLSLTQGALKPILFSSLSLQKDKVLAGLRCLLEIDYPIGNIIYQDDYGVVLAVPAFYEGENDGHNSDQLFQQHIIQMLQDKVLQEVAPLGIGTAVRVAWTQPALYLTDYHQVLAHEAQGQNELLLQAGLSELKAIWQKKNTQGEQVQICPQCGLRPGVARELEIYQSGLDDDDTKLPQGWCDFCVNLVQQDQQNHRWRQAYQGHFGFVPQTFNIQNLRQARNGKGNARVVLLSVRVDAEKFASGEAFITQLARPLADITDIKDNLKTAASAGDFLQSIWQRLLPEASEDTLKKTITKKEAAAARTLLGDNYWLDFHPHEGKNDNKDSRSLNPHSGGKCIEVAENFFLKEYVPENLSRHVGDSLLLFGMRKHASPGRLARTWDDLRTLWSDLLSIIAADTEGYAIPLSLDAQGFRVIVAAKDARGVLLKLQKTLSSRLAKVRGGIAPQLSALIFKEKFPLYVAIDALRRMEQRCLPAQEWTLLNTQTNGQDRNLHWQTPQGKVVWNVNTGTGDSKRPDIWHPHVISTSRPIGVEQLVHFNHLKSGDKVKMPVATFDFAVLDGTARRYEISYDDQGERSHFILGEHGYKPHLMEHMPWILEELPKQIADWNPSQSKAILGQIVECYEKWVRDVPYDLKAQGREAWHLHTEAILRQAKFNVVDGIDLISLLDNGCLFDAFEWSGFIEKTS